MAGQDGVHAVVDGQGAQPPQGVQIVAQPAVGVRHDGRTAPQDGVTGQDGPVGGQMEAQGVTGVAGRRDDPQFQTPTVTTSPGASPSSPSRSAGSSARTFVPVSSANRAAPPRDPGARA
ncbi:hypothetical protein SAVCW2_33660 [Streptomyces avermitilis]|nr:hypothetical protein SAVCW2_33660 [Streptomyces avermitilis]